MTNKEIADLLLVGQMMSNVCYSIAQGGVEFADFERESMDALRRRWDVARTAYYGHKKARSKKRRKAKVGRG